MAKKIIKSKKKTIREVREGRIYIQSSFNNTLILITDQSGNSLVQTSAGLAGFKGTKKATPYAAGQATKLALAKIEPFGLQTVSILVSGVGPGRDAALRALTQSSLQVESIKDVTPVPHNGPRSKKPRRV